MDINNVLVSLLNELVPDGTNKEFKVGDVKVKINKKGDEFSLNVIDTDSETKECIKNFKDKINKLDDDIFVKSLETIGQVIDVNAFANFLEKESFTKKESENVSDLISTYVQQMNNYLDHEIQKLISFRKLFCE